MIISINSIIITSTLDVHSRSPCLHTFIEKVFHREITRPVPFRREPHARDGVDISEHSFNVFILIIVVERRGGARQGSGRRRCGGEECGAGARGSLPSCSEGSWWSDGTTDVRESPRDSGSTHESNSRVPKVSFERDQNGWGHSTVIFAPPRRLRKPGVIGLSLNHWLCACCACVRAGACCIPAGICCCSS